MNDFNFRTATITDIPFLVETIIEAEKSGTDKLSYSTVFGLSIDEVRKFIAAMLAEEVDGCELSISSFLIAEQNGQIAAALSAWVELSEGIPSNILKGNLLNFIIPKKYLEKAKEINPLIRELHIDYSPNTIQIGAGYVASQFRGNNLLGRLNNQIIANLLTVHPHVTHVCVQIFGSNIPSIRTYEKAGFEIGVIKESSNSKILDYLPFNKKVLMKKDFVNSKI